MRILLFSRYHLTSYVGGNEVYLDSIARVLADHERFEPVYASFSTVTDHLPYKHIRLDPSTIFTYLTSCWKIIKNVQPDIVHTSGSSWEHVLLSLMSRIAEKTAIHSFLAPTHPKVWIIGWLSRFEIVLINLVYQGVLTINHRDLSLFPAKQMSGRATCVPPIMTVKKLHTLCAIPRKLSTRGSEGVVLKKLLFVGTLDSHHYYKGLEVLLEAMTKLSDEHTLRIVGDGDMLSEYTRLARTYKVLDRVKFEGAVSNAQLISAYASSDVLVLPSTSDSEGFGIVAVEALATGMGVVVSSAAGVADLLINADLGSIVNPQDTQSLVEGIERELRLQLTRKLIEKRRNFAKRFSELALKRTLFDYYQSFDLSEQ